MKRILTTLLFTILCIGLQAQIKVSTTNKVGISTSNPLSLLSVNTDGATDHLTYFYDTNVERLSKIELDNPTGNYGIALNSVVRLGNSTKMVASNFQSYSSTVNSCLTFGVRSTVGNGYDGKNYAVYGSLLGSRNGAAIVGVFGGTEPTIPGLYTGYFHGDVKIGNNGTLFVNTIQYTSDIRLKTDVRSISSDAGEKENLLKISSLNAIKYKFIDPSTLIESSASDTTSVIINPVEPDSRDHIGLSAQEIRLVFPELVMEDSEGYLSVDYTGLIPVLIEATKEQQTIIEELQSELLKMKTEIENLKALPIK